MSYVEVNGLRSDRAAHQREAMRRCVVLQYMPHELVGHYFVET